jgi:hypothetical protein
VSSIPAGRNPVSVSGTEPARRPAGLPVNGLSANVSTVLNRTMAAEVERTGIEPVISGLQHPPARRRNGRPRRRHGLRAKVANQTRSRA